jgi:prepilin-type N-terminal cleavage/methylation domain-containing protein
VRLSQLNPHSPARRQAFTLIELMMASGIGLVFAGAVVALLYQAGVEQRSGLADATVEDKAYTLQENISSCLRIMSSNQGISPDYNTAATDSHGNLLGYQTIYVFLANANGSYTTEKIHFDPTTGAVVYTPNGSAPGTTILWMTNSPTVALRQLYFNTSFNPDGSLDSSLVNVRLQMDDNGASRQNVTNNPASIYRSFSVQMRSD